MLDVRSIATSTARRASKHALAWLRTLIYQPRRRPTRVVGRHAKAGELLMPSRLEMIVDSVVAPLRGANSAMETASVRRTCQFGYVGLVIGLLTVLLP
jgi:hypothetical protein